MTAAEGAGRAKGDSRSAMLRCAGNDAGRCSRSDLEQSSGSLTGW